MSSITVTVRERVSASAVGTRGRPEVGVQCAPQSHRGDAQPEIALQCTNRSYWPAGSAGGASAQSED
jgi:hypothetical protein